MSRGPIYGNILSLRTSGASSKTAEGDNLGYSGVKASHKMAEMDADRMEKYRDKINRAGSKYEIDSGLIAGIISRESRAGKALDKGWGDNGKAWGLMQVDITSDGGGHKARGDWDSEEHLCQATEILVKFIKRIRDKFPKWSVEEQLQGGIAAYNQGDGSVHSYGSVDEHTTGGDYSNDVIARAQWYKRNRGYSHVSLCTMS